MAGCYLFLLFMLTVSIKGISSGKTQWLFKHKHNTSCQTPRPVFEGEPSFITCKFADDVRRWKLDFGVTRYDLEGFDPLGDLISSCTWGSDDYNPICSHKDGYRTNLTASGDHMTIGIPSTGHEHVGRYSCRYALSWPDDERHCTLAMKDRNSFCTLSRPTVSVGTSANVTCHFSVDVRKTRKRFQVYRFDHLHTRPTQVAYCTWAVQDANGQPFCQLKPGYKLDVANIGSNATLTIQSVDNSHSGRYSCRTIPDNKNVTIIDCTLSVRERKAVTGVKAGGEINQTAAENNRKPVPTSTTSYDVTKDPCASRAAHLHGLSISAMLVCLLAVSIALTARADSCISKNACKEKYHRCGKDGETAMEIAEYVKRAPKRVGGVKHKQKPAGVYLNTRPLA